MTEPNGHDTDGNQEPQVRPETIDLAARTLRGDLRDRLLDLVRTTPKQWHALSEAEQREVAHRVNDAVAEAVRQAVEIIAADGRVTIQASLEAIKIGKGIEGKVTLSRYDPQRHLLFDCQGADVLIVLADAERYSRERGPAKVEPDQVGLPLEALEVEPGTEEPPAGEPGEANEGELSRENGRQAALHGFNESRNPFDLQTEPKPHKEWLAGWQDGEAERVANAERADQPRRRGRPRKGAGPHPEPAP